MKCGNHESGCAWKGCIADYAAHAENNCSVGREHNNSALMEELESLRKKNSELKELGIAITDAYAAQCARIAELEYQNEKLKQESDSLKQSPVTLSKQKSTIIPAYQFYSMGTTITEGKMSCNYLN